MSRPRLLFYCQHSLGLGHLARVAALAERPGRRLRRRPAQRRPAAGGHRAPAGRAGRRTCRRSGHDDGLPAGQPRPGAGASRRRCRERRRTILDVLEREAPAVVLVELYPFGRKKFEFELLPLLEAARVGAAPAAGRVQPARHPGPRAPRPGRARRARAAGVRTRSSTRCSCTPTRRSPGSRSRSRRARRCRCRSTTPASSRRPRSRPAPAAPAAEAAGVRRRRHGRRAAGPRGGARARRGRGRARGLGTTVVAGPVPPRAGLGLAAARGRAIAACSTPYAGSTTSAREISRSAVSLSQAGYNTTMDLLRAGTPAVVVPYSDGREDEQASRARRLEASSGVLRMVPPPELGTDRLLDELRRPRRHPRPHPVRPRPRPGRRPPRGWSPTSPASHPIGLRSRATEVRDEQLESTAVPRPSAWSAWGTSAWSPRPPWPASGTTWSASTSTPSKVRRLRAGDVPVVELGARRAARTSTAHRLTWSSTPPTPSAGPGIVFVTVDTPGLPSGDADLSRVESVIDQIPPDVPPLMLVMKSTVPVGTGARVQRELRARGLTRVRYVSNPEFLREGTALRDVMHPDRVVVGADDPARRGRGRAPVGAPRWRAARAATSPPPR